jgi:hypothetical protein
MLITELVEHQKEEVHLKMKVFKTESQRQMQIFISRMLFWYLELFVSFLKSLFNLSGKTS